MTSRSSFFKNQQELLRRRLWPLTLSVLLFFLYHVMILPLAVSDVISSGEMYEYTAEKILLESAGLASTLTGFRSVGSWLITIPLAVVLAMQGYAWLHSRRELDFYESQPIPRRKHFTDIYVNSILIYMFAYLATLLPGCLICFALGGMTGNVFTEALLQFLRALVLFLGCHAVSVLAMMLTGNILIALLGVGTLFLIELLIRTMVFMYMDYFLKTYIFESVASVLALKASPVSLYFTGFAAILERIEETGYLANASGLGISPFPLMGAALAEDIAGLVLTAVITALAFCCYRVRRSEDAGKAVIFRPVRTLNKAAWAFFFSAGTGALVYGMFSKGIATVAAVLVLTVVALIVCCVLEIIYGMSFKGLFRHSAETVTIIGLCILFFLGFRYDLAGFDHRLPSPAQVESSAIYTDNYYRSYVNENGRQQSPAEWNREHMFLTDTEAVLALSENGIRWTLDTDERSAESRSLGYNVIFRLKNGRTEQRRFYVRPEENAEVLDRILSSEEYKKAAFALEDDTFFQNKKNSVEFEFSSLCGHAPRRKASYDAFLEAYRKDLGQYGYSFARDTDVIGEVSASVTYPSAPGAYTLTVNHDFEVYAAYANTIRFLKENDLWAEPLPEPSGVSYIRIWEADGDAWQKPEAASASFTDPEEIRAILGALSPDLDIYHFQDPDKADRDYQVEISLVPVQPEDAENRYALFRKGAMPDFVKERLR